MEDTIPTTIESQQTADRTLAEIPEIPEKKSLLVPILLGVAVLILGAIFGILLRDDLKRQTPDVIQTSSPTPTPTMSTNQPLSAIASTSAFLQTESAIASLSAAAKVLNVSDTTLNHPSLDLPLGLETK
ncbi:MAG: hypothetical protein V1917_02865 [Candidatus Gottesmanbacteria bacterium]